MKILVTGGSGFIGSNFINLLQSKGADVLNVDLVNNNNCNTKICDVRDSISFSAIVNKYSPRYIVHLAARTDLDGNQLTDYDTNILGVEVVCEASLSCSSVKKTIFASSMLVCQVGYVPKNICDFNATTLYGQSKVEGEHIVRKLYSGGNYAIFRPTSIWGPGFKEPYRNFFDMVLSGRYFDMQSSVGKTYGYIENSVNQIYNLMLSNEDYSKELIYIGDEKVYNISEWALKIAHFSNIKKPYSLPMFMFYFAAKFGDMLSIFNIRFPLTSFRLKNMTTENLLDCSLANELHSSKYISFDECIEKTLIWMSEDEK